MHTSLTEEKVSKTIVRFSIPFLCSYFLQTVYGMVDLLIIGQFYQVQSTTAVSIGSQIMHMITVMIVGLAMGTVVTIGRAVGAKKQQDVNQYVGNSITLFMLLSFISTFFLFHSIDLIVALVSTPSKAIVETTQYLRICFFGIPLITIYNLISAIFRGMGDSKKPLYIIAIACCLNVIFDYAFIAYFHMGVAGAAYATIFAQFFSVLLAGFYLIKKSKTVLPKKEDYHLQWKRVKEIGVIGLPIMIQDGCIQIAFLLITVFVNQRGLYDAAAVGIVEKMICLLFLVPSSMLQTVSSLSALNLGAKKPERAHEVLKDACIITICWGVFIVFLMHISIGFFMQLFTKNEQVMILGSQYMKGYVWDCIFAGLHFSFSGYFCAYGLSTLSFLHNIVSILVVRIPCAYFASCMFDSLYPMGLAVSLGSFVSVLICLLAYSIMKPREAKLLEKL